MLAGSLRSRRIIRQVLLSWDTAAPQFSNGLKKTRLFPGYRQRVALYSAYRQRVGDVSSVAAAKLSLSAPGLFRTLRIIDKCSRPIQRYIAKTSHIRLSTHLDDQAYLNYQISTAHTFF